VLLTAKKEFANMSSPFSVFFKNLRIRTGLRQSELARQLGYEQSYISAIELGNKGPSQELLDKLNSLYLSERDHEEMLKAARESNRRFILPIEVPLDTYHFCNELWSKIGDLHPAQISAMREVIKIDDQIAERPNYGAVRIRRRKGEAQM
jgi:transcriptional regulator with XRE-family HTH domain